MIRDLHDIDKLFKDGLEGNPEPVPPAAWEALNNDLDKMQASHFREKYYRVKKLALLLLIFVFSASIYMFYYISSGKKDLAAAKKQASTQNNTATNTTAEKTETADNTPAINNKKENSTALNNTPHKQQTLNNKQVNTITAGEANTNQPAGLSDKSFSNKEVLHRNDAGHKAAPLQNSGNKDDAASAAKKTKQISLPADNNYIAAEKHLKNIAADDAQFSEKNTSTTLRTNNTKKDASYYNNKPGKGIGTTATHKNKQGSMQEAEWLTETGNKNIVGNNSLVITSNNQQQTAYKRSSSLANYLEQPASIVAFNAVAAPPFSKFNSLLLSDSVQNENQKTANVYLKQKAPLQQRFSLTAFVSPNSSFTRLKNNERLAGPGYYDKNEARRSEQQGSSYSAGLLVNYNLSRNFILQSGLVYSSAKTNIAAKTIYARQDNNGHTQYEFNCSMGNSYIMPHNGTPPAIGDSIKISGSSSTITYIGIPVYLQYVLRKGKFLFKPGVGFSVNFLTSGQSSSTLTSAGSKVQEKAAINGLKKMYTDGILGLGIEYKLNRRFSVGVTPLMRWAFTPVNTNTPVSRYQNYLSLETGLKINL